MAEAYWSHRSVLVCLTPLASESIVSCGVRKRGPGTVEHLRNGVAAAESRLVGRRGDGRGSKPCTGSTWIGAVDGSSFRA